MEDELKKAKKRQAMLDNIGVVVATLIMVIMALTIVSIKVMYASISITKIFWQCNIVGKFYKFSLSQKKFDFHLKVVMFRKETGNATWTPLPQRWNSTARVTGHGFIPCKGYI